MLIFQKSNQTLKIKSLTPPIPEEELKTAETRGKTVGDIGNTLVFTGLGVGVVGVMLQFPVMTFLIKFVLIMKIVNRFKLLNIRFGDYLDAFLSGLFNVFEGGDVRIKEENVQFDSKSRGRVSFFEVEVVVFYSIYPKYVLYMVRSVFFSIKFSL